MKEHLLELVGQAISPAHGRNIARDYLQARILESLQRKGAMIPLAFHGGTALRFIYSHRRYSEDLDFALEKEHHRYDLRAYLTAIRRDLELETYSIELKVSDKKVVHNAFVRFPGLLYQLGLSPHRDETLGIKIEVDTRPPEGAILATILVRRHVMLQLQHHDPASMFAGKLHAILQRPYLKGRDLYDLFWYLSDPAWPPPNLVLLNNALNQTSWSGEEIDNRNWRYILRKHLKDIDWISALEDVKPFLEPGEDTSLISYDNLMRLLESNSTEL